MPPQASDAEDAVVSQSDEGVRTAFALGWHMSELYRRGEGKMPPAEPRAGLPGVGSLAEAERGRLRLSQIDAALARLGEAITDAGLSAPDTDAVREAVDRGEEELREAVLALHTELLRVLTAADFRLGKGYGLGRALCDTCRVESAAEVTKQLGRDRLGKLYSWLLDLKSVLPPHAGEAAYNSLREWELWASRRELGAQGLGAGGDRGDVRGVLFRQGEIWRALLSGEKQATDMLVPRDYVDAAGRLFTDGVRLLGRLPRSLWLVVFGALGLAIAGLIAAALTGSGSGVVAALGGLAAALGISWAGVRNSLGAAVARLREPLWGAALDGAIVVAITRVKELEASAPGGAGEDA